MTPQIVSTGKHFANLSDLADDYAHWLRAFRTEAATTFSPDDIAEFGLMLMTVGLEFIDDRRRRLS